MACIAWDLKDSFVIGWKKRFDTVKGFQYYIHINQLSR